jgi:invasion protein IalB
MITLSLKRVNSDCCNQEDCIYPVCLEQEIADRVRAEEEAQIDIFEESEDESDF